MSNNFQTINPATGETIQSYQFMSDDQASGKVDACHNAFLDWRLKPFDQRGSIIRKIGEELQTRKEEFAQLMTQEMGKLLEHAREEVDLCTAICDWSAENAAKELASEERELGDGARGIISHVPIGVIYGIQPWNFPGYQVIRYSIANLMAGNGVLLKHAQSVTGCALLLEEIYEAAGLPKNLFSVLIIDHDQSDHIIENQHVRGVTLTGSAAAGSHVGAAAAKALKKTVLELGSNDAYLILEDADLELAVETCVLGRIYNNAETCISAKRFVVVDAIYDAFRDAFVKAMRDIKLGDPTSEATDLGPMARADLRDDLHEQVTQSTDKGAKILCGGEMPEGKGCYYPSTVLENVTPGQPAYDDELFGPVASLIRAKDADDAMRIANDSKFGLGGGIISKDVDKAIDLATRYFDTGMVFINGFGLAQPNMPFGGVKNSGYGREHGGFGLREFVNTKAVMIMS